MRPRSVCLAVACVLAAGCAVTPQRPAERPESYRDFKIYSTSRPDPDDPARIVLTLEMRNEGGRPLRPSARLEPSPEAGFAGCEFERTIPPDSSAQWVMELLPPEGLEHEVLRGEIRFGGVRARELYVALQGPDPEDFEPGKLQRLTARATAVGTHAPRVRVDWWRTHPSSSITPEQRVRPLLTLAANAQTDYCVAVGPMPAAGDGTELTLEEWSQRKDLRPGELDLIRAVEDLQRCLRVMTGAELPIRSDATGGSPAIRLRVDGGEPWPHPDAYHLHTTPAGDVVVEAGHVDGLRQGVYGLLTDHLDCHWFLPRQLGEEIPATGSAVIGQIDERREPSFFSVSGMSFGGAPRWDRRNRAVVNRGRMSFGHAWNSLITPSESAYEAHPDWWAKDREGKIRHSFSGYNRTNFCSTNPEVIETIAQKINGQLSNPQALIASLDPNDYGPMCLCDRCLALDKHYGVTQEDGTYVTDRLLHFSREIYDRLEEKNKDKFLGILVYAYQMELPNKAVPHDHHVGLVCNMSWEYDHTRPFNDPTAPTSRDFYRLLKGWGKILPQFGYYDYYGHFSDFGPWGQVFKMREDLPAFRDVGGTFLMIEAQPNFGLHGLNLYIAARLAWDVDADVDVLLEEFFAKFYGPAAEPMRWFWLAIERHYALSRPGPHAARRVCEREQMWQELDGCLKEAEALAAGTIRFRDRVAFHREAFEYGRAVYAGKSKYFPPGGPPDYEGAIKALQERAPEIERLKQKYNNDYWPTLIRPYFYPNVPQLIERLREQAEAAKSRDAEAQ